MLEYLQKHFSKSFSLNKNYLSFFYLKQKILSSKIAKLSVSITAFLSLIFSSVIIYNKLTKIENNNPESKQEPVSQDNSVIEILQPNSEPEIQQLNDDDSEQKEQANIDLELQDANPESEVLQISSESKQEPVSQDNSVIEVLQAGPEPKIQQLNDDDSASQQEPVSQDNSVIEILQPNSEPEIQQLNDDASEQKEQANIDLELQDANPESEVLQISSESKEEPVSQDNLSPEVIEAIGKLNQNDDNVYLSSSGQLCIFQQNDPEKIIAALKKGITEITLNIGQIEFKNDTQKKEIFEAIKNNKNLKTISYYNTSNDAQLFDEFCYSIKGKKTIKELFIAKGALGAFFKNAIKTLPNLEHLSIAGVSNKINLNFENLFSAQTKLKSLHFLNTKISDIKKSEIIKSVNSPNLSSLKFYNEEIKTESANQINSLILRSNKLNQLILDEVKISDSNLASIINTAKINPNLQKLEISNLNKHNSIEFNSKQALYDLVKTNFNIKSLSLPENNLGDDFIQKLFHNLSTNEKNSLKKLKLIGNDIQDSGLKLIHELLEKPSLHKLATLKLRDPYDDSENDLEDSLFGSLFLIYDTEYLLAQIEERIELNKFLDEEINEFVILDEEINEFVILDEKINEFQVL